MNSGLIADGVVGGFGAALVRARGGLPMRLFERAAAFHELGAGIRLGPNVFPMLDRLGIRAAIDHDAMRTAMLVIHCAMPAHPQSAPAFRE